MRAHVPSYELVSHLELSEVLDLMGRNPGVWKPFAGGTDLMVLLESGKLAHRKYFNIWNLKELRGIDVSDAEVTIGALTTYTEIQSHPTLSSEFPMLCQAASETGGLAIQNRGTLGGNIVNASPAADSPPALLAYDAELELLSTGGERRLPYQNFHTGYKQMDIRPDELLSRIRIPRPSNALRHYYRKVGTRKAQAISKTCFAATARIENDIVAHVRIAMGSVAPVPLRCVKTEAVLLGQTIDGELIQRARTEFAGEITPIDDVRSTQKYRSRVSLNLLEDFLHQLQEG